MRSPWFTIKHLVEVLYRLTKTLPLKSGSIIPAVTLMPCLVDRPLRERSLPCGERSLTVAVSAAVVSVCAVVEGDTTIAASSFGMPSSCSAMMVEEISNLGKVKPASSNCT